MEVKKFMYPSVLDTWQTDVNNATKWKLGNLSMETHLLFVKLLTRLLIERLTTTAIQSQEETFAVKTMISKIAQAAQVSLYGISLLRAILMVEIKCLKRHTIVTKTPRR